MKLNRLTEPTLAQINYIFSQALELQDCDRASDFIFENLDFLDDMTIVSLLNKFLLQEEIQGSNNTGISDAIGFNRKPNTKIILQNII